MHDVAATRCGKEYLVFKKGKNEHAKTRVLELQRQAKDDKAVLPRHHPTGKHAFPPKGDGRTSGRLDEPDRDSTLPERPSQCYLQPLPQPSGSPDTQRGAMAPYTAAVEGHRHVFAMRISAHSSDTPAVRSRLVTSTADGRARTPHPAPATSEDPCACLHLRSTSTRHPPDSIDVDSSRSGRPMRMYPSLLLSRGSRATRTTALARSSSSSWSALCSR
ncbi:hypothetical protein C8R45DRAFT_1006038, partial [Mycena sanguinolenta]